MATLEAIYVFGQHREDLRKKVGFRTIAALQQWLDSEAIKPYFVEFVSDYLFDHRDDDDAEYDKVTQMLGVHEVLQLRSYSPDETPANKDGWSCNKHWTRFMSQVFTYCGRNETAWKGPQSDDMEICFYQIFEVLSFLKKEWLAEQEE